MLTLITGTPGAGKTAWTVQELTRLPAQRKIFVHGIPELKIAHEPVYCMSDLCEHCRSLVELVSYPASIINGKSVPAFQRYEEIARPGEPVYLVEEWPEWATHGSLIVLDEVQRVWRPSSTKVPNEVAALETHRHKGLDFWMISQGPHLFHSNIRLLIGRHIHLVDLWYGRKEYEFPECRQNVTSRADAVERSYKLPKKIFGMYKSSSLHTKLDHRKPLSFYFMLAAILIGLGLLWKVTERFASMGQPVAAVGGGDADAPAAAAPAPAPPMPPPNQPAKSPSNFPDFKPTLPGLPESAPAYASLNQVVNVPHVTSCAKTPDWCKCYAGRGAPYPVTRQFCEAFLRGEYFNPWKARTVPNDKPELKPYPITVSKK